MTAQVKNLASLYRKCGLFPSRCRYFPSCSCYAEGAIEKYGFFKGSFLALLRLLRCNQLFPGGYDPVP